MAIDLLMINLRYHIVSLVAVFLALAIGVIAGTTVINDQVVKGLERSDKTLRGSLKTQQDANAALNSQLSLWETWGSSVAKGLEKDQLKGKTVLLLMSSGIDGKIVSNVQNALTIAGASRGGSITFSSRWNFSDATAVQQLGSIFGLGPAATAADVGTQGADKLASRMDAPGDPNSAGDVLQALSHGGFIQFSDPTGGSFPPAGSLVVWLSSGAADPSPPDGQFSLPLLRALVERVTVAVAEPMGSADSLCDQILGDTALSKTVATVDHADTIPGVAALIVGLHDVAAGLPAPHYGTRRGTTAVAPTP
ncbi:MAG TPA: copper transporter [Actinomycetota bacterium]|nr:copper transporter [Actinomycetota bacterium]